MVEPHRDETEAEKYDRNWVELVQELRVAQTGIQVLAGFLLTLPFTSRFEDLDDAHRVIYLVAISLAMVTIGLMTAPAALHRFLFSRGAKDVLVHTGDTVAKAAMASMGLTLVTVVLLIFSVVAGDLAGIIAAVAIALFFVLAWVVMPWQVRRRVER
ncbi:MAG TPA: DUF6328 family protein [Marmoricola sp.]|nr:DUF6328 family protein [Marmoricola sp.]